jgi:hypothetical protein
MMVSGVKIFRMVQVAYLLTYLLAYSMVQSLS